MKHFYTLLTGMLLAYTHSLFASLGFVPNQDNNTISVVNSETNQIIRTISVGQSPQTIVLNANNTRAYVANTGSNSISIIDTVSFAVIDTITSIEFNEPNSLVIDPKDRYLAVGNGGNNNLVIIELGNTPEVTATLDLGFTTSPRSMAVTPNGFVIYVPDTGSNVVAVVDMTQTPPTHLSNITVGNNPVSVAVSPAYSFAAVANKSDNTVSIISLINHSVSETVAVGSEPSHVSFSYDSSEVYVANANSMSTISLDISKGIEVEQKPVKILLTPDGQTAYVSNQNSKTLSAIDTTTFHVLANIDMGIRVDDFVSTSNSDKIYAISADSNELKIVNTFTHKVSSLNLPDTPGGITFQDATSLVLVSLPYQGKLQVINSIDDSVIGSIFTTKSESDTSWPTDIVTPPGSQLAYVLNNNNPPGTLTESFMLPFNVPANVSLGVLNPGNLQITDEIVLSNWFSNSLFMTPDGSYICAINAGLNTLSIPLTPFIWLPLYIPTAGTTTIIDTSNNSILGSPITGGNASQMASTYDGSFLYTANGNQGSLNVPEYALFLISTTNGVETANIGTLPTRRMKVTPNDKFLYTITTNPDSIYAFSVLSNGAIIFTNPYEIHLGNPAGTGAPEDLDFNLDSTLAFITNGSDNSVSIIPIDPEATNPIARIWYNIPIDILNSTSVSTIATETPPGVIVPDIPNAPDTPPILPGVPTPTPEEPINIPDTPQAPQPSVCSCANTVWLVSPQNNTVTIRKLDSSASKLVNGFSNPSDIAIMLRKEYLLHTVFTLNTIGNQWASERFASLSWSGFPGALEYKLYRNDEFLTSFTPDINSYEDHNLSFDTNYTYTLYICTESGELQAYQFQIVE